MIYDAADKAIREMNRKNLKAFNRLKLADWDKINLIRTVKQVYETSAGMARERYLEIAAEAYQRALLECGKKPRDAARMTDETIDRDWVLDMLEESDPVTLYAFMTETERKAQRLAEALEATERKNAEIDKALKAWTGQIGQYADNAVFYARMDAFIDAGIERVRWETQRDDRVCESCHELDGQVFPLREAPGPQHWHCRCVLRPVMD